MSFKHVGDSTVAAVVVALAAVVLRLIPPGAGTIYPPCVFRLLTGWHCPGCGSLRALHALTDGNVVLAWSMNPLLVLFVVGLAGSVALRALQIRVRPLAWTYPVLPLVIVAFWVGRNV